LFEEAFAIFKKFDVNTSAIQVIWLLLRSFFTLLAYKRLQEEGHMLKVEMW
jgi:DNA polymerase III delta subunit